MEEQGKAKCIDCCQCKCKRIHGKNNIKKESGCNTLNEKHTMCVKCGEYRRQWFKCLKDEAIASEGKRNIVPDVTQIKLMAPPYTCLRRLRIRSSGRAGRSGGVAAVAAAGGRQSHRAGWLEQNLDVLAVSDALGQFWHFGAFLAVLECFSTFLDGFGPFRTLVLTLETTRGDRYLRRQVYGDYITLNHSLHLLIFIFTHSAKHFRRCICKIYSLEIYWF